MMGDAALDRVCSSGVAGRRDGREENAMGAAVGDRWWRLKPGRCSGGSGRRRWTERAVAVAVGGDRTGRRRWRRGRSLRRWSERGGGGGGAREVDRAVAERPIRRGGWRWSERGGRRRYRAGAERPVRRGGGRRWPHVSRGADRLAHLPSV